jgi:hypothetical protein
MGTPGCTGGGAGRSGALYTGRGPVCGTIIRGGGGGAAGRAAIGADGGALAETTGGATAAGTCGGGATGRTGGVAAGDTVPGDDAAGGATAGRGATTGAAGGAVTAAAGSATVGLVAGGATTGRLTPAGRVAAGACGAPGRAGAAGAAASFFCVIAFSTSPGREMFDRSILVLISSSPRDARELDLPAEDEPSAEERMWTRTFSASCSSRELECVFFSVTPTTASASRIALLLTSSSRARSLIRTLLIRPFGSPCCS